MYISASGCLTCGVIGCLEAQRTCKKCGKAYTKQLRINTCLQ